MFRKLGTTLLMASFVLLAGRTAFADTTTTYTLGAGNSSVTPAAWGTPYGSVLVDLNTAGTMATITFTAASGYLFLGEGIAAVNINATSWTISGLTGTTLAGFSGPQLTDTGAGQEDGFGNFNQTFKEFDGFDYALQTVSFTVTKGSGTWASAASVLTGNDDTNLLAAHIGECNVNPCVHTNGSFTSTGYVSETGAINNPVPEPSSLALFGSGIIGVAAVVRRRVRVPTA